MKKPLQPVGTFRPRTRAAGIQIGKRYNEWTPLELVGRSASRVLIYRCRCSCGVEKNVHASGLRGGSRSCGHDRRAKDGERMRAMRTTHSQSGTPLYNIWKAMRQRCSNPNDGDWEAYGGRGITVCERWQSFEAFASDMGPRPTGTSINRVNNDKGYSPDNCEWATSTEQARNRRPRRKTVSTNQTQTRITT